jgi:hypothetical protein
MKKVFAETVLRIKCCYYSWRDGVKFEKGYKYKMIRHTDLDTMEKHHKLLLDLGWTKESDVNAGFTYAWCWYRKLNNV